MKYLYAGTVTAMMILLAISCQKNTNQPVSGLTGVQADAASAKKALLATDCVDASDSVIGGPVDSSDVGSYCDWTPVGKALTGGSFAPTIQFEGQFNSFIRPLTPGWFVGVIDSTYFDSSWCAMIGALTPKAGNEGNSPNCTLPSRTRFNVVGFDGAFSPTENYGLGYYSYVIGIPSVQRSVVLWQGTSPSAASHAYIVKIRSLGFTPGGPGYKSDVQYSYRCLSTSCP